MPLPSTPNDISASGRGLRFNGWLVAALCAIPALVHLAVLYANASGMPMGDDYLAIIDYLARWEKTAGQGASRLGMVFEQFYSHRIPFTHLALTTALGALGRCDLRLLMAFAWLGWLLLFLSLVWCHRSSREQRPWGLLPVALLLFQPQGYTNFLVATGSPGHAWTLLLAFWVCQLAATPKPGRQAGALLLAVCASLCTANGLLIFPVIVLGQALGRNWRTCVAWAAAGAATWSWYFSSYSVASQPFAQHHFSLTEFALNAMMMTGGVIKFGTLSLTIAATAGLILIVLAVAVWGVEQRRHADSRTAAFLLFILLSIAMTAYARIGWGAGYMLQDRYAPYGLLLITTLYLWWLYRFDSDRRPILMSCALLAGLVFNLASYAQKYADLVNSRRQSEASAMNLNFDYRLAVQLPDAQAAAVRSTLLRYASQNRLVLPDLLSPGNVSQISRLPAEIHGARSPAWSCVPSEAQQGFLLVPPPGLPHHESTKPDFAVIIQDGRPTVLPVLGRRPRFDEVLREFKLLSNSYALLLSGTHYLKGSHELIGLRRQTDGTLSMLWSAVVQCP